MNGLRWNRHGPQAAPEPIRRPMPNRRRAALRTLSLCWAAALPALATAQDNCTPQQDPPVVPAALLKPGTPWASLAQFMAAQKITFDVSASDSAIVIPCTVKGGGLCVPMAARVLSEQRTFCLTSAMAGDGQARFAGVVVRDSGGSTSQLAHLGFGTANATDSVYLLVQSNQSIALFHGRGNVVRIINQNVSLDSGWAFVFHPEPGPFPAPEARWRPTDPMAMARPYARPPVHGGGPTDLLAADEGGGAVQDNTSYAWMACAAGCCQFHGLPAGSGLPGDGDDMDEGGHHNPHHPRHRMSVRKDAARGQE